MKPTIALGLLGFLALAVPSTRALADGPAAASDLRTTLQTATTEVGDFVEFQVKDLDKAVQAKLSDPTTWRLSLDDMPLTNSKPVIDLDRNIVRFQLIRADGDKATWEHVLGEPPASGVRDVTVRIRTDATH